MSTARGVVARSASTYPAPITRYEDISWRIIKTQGEKIGGDVPASGILGDYLFWGSGTLDAHCVFFLLCYDIPNLLGCVVLWYAAVGQDGSCRLRKEKNHNSFNDISLARTDEPFAAPPHQFITFSIHVTIPFIHSVRAGTVASGITV